MAVSAHASSVSTNVSTTEARNDFSELISCVAYGGDRVEITRNGKPLVALISIKDLEAMQAIEDAMDVRAAQEAMEEGDFMDADEFFASLEG